MRSWLVSRKSYSTAPSGSPHVASSPSSKLLLLVVGCSIVGPIEKTQIGTLPVRGTLVVGVPTPSGLVILADKRSYDRLRGDLDIDNKIIQLDRRTAFAGTGYVKFYDILTDTLSGKQTLRLGYNAEDIVTQYSQTTPFIDSLEYWRALAKKLIDTFEAYLKPRPYTFWPETGSPPDNALFQILFFHVADDGTLTVKNVRFCYTKQLSPIITTTLGEIPAGDFKMVKPIVAGNIDVYNQLHDGDDKRFDDIRKDKPLMRILKLTPPVQSISLRQAREFGRKLIKVTHERTHLIEKSDFHVGPTYDCALLSRRAGFTWLAKNKNVDDARR